MTTVSVDSVSLTVEVSTASAAATDDPHGFLDDILEDVRVVAVNTEWNHPTVLILRDVNGNPVGHATISITAEEG